LRDENCALCNAIKSEIQLDYYAGFVILKTKNKKGHAKRCMVVTSNHRRQLKQPEEDTATAFLFRFIESQHRDHDWTIMQPTHASIPEHWHLVASTLDEGEDQYLIEDTDRIEIRFKQASGRSRK
jgi:hypothetical protein